MLEGLFAQCVRVASAKILRVSAWLERRADCLVQVAAEVQAETYARSPRTQKLSQGLWNHSQRTQYPELRNIGLRYEGILMMTLGIFLCEGVLGSLGFANHAAAEPWQRRVTFCCGAMAGRSGRCFSSGARIWRSSAEARRQRSRPLFLA